MFQVRLKQLRENANYSQYSFANEIGVAQSTVGMWESGMREPNYKTTQKIADFFNVSIDYLLGKSDIQNFVAEQRSDSLDLDPEVRIIARGINELSRADKDLLKAFIENASQRGREAALG